MYQQPSYKIYLSANDLPNAWDKLGRNLFLQSSYLRGQEFGLPSNMKIYYVAFF